MANIALIVGNVLSDSGVAITSNTSGTSGTSGATGANGTSGVSGTSGSSGLSGTSGTSGVSGSSGTSGANGTSGSSGASGTSGSSGLSGTSGSSGSSGLSGTSGSGGTSGTRGTGGTSGINGTSGTGGTSGINGTSGTGGTSGINGTSGSGGTSGTRGTGGTSGINGTSGTSGVTGANGANGTSGLNGAAGTSGTSGTSGATGASGTSGTSGATGTSGAAGTSGTSGTNGLLPSNSVTYGGYSASAIKGGWYGILMGSTTSHLNYMADGSGNGGIYRENGGQWPIYWNTSHACVGLGSSNTYAGYSARAGSIYVDSAAYSPILYDANNTAYYVDPASTSNMNAITCVSLTETSSKRYKENIYTLDNALDKVVRLRGVSYNRKGNKTQEIGVIAEEIADIIPEVVNFNSDKEPDSVSYGRITALLIEAIKELKTEIEILKQK